MSPWRCHRSGLKEEREGGNMDNRVNGDKGIRETEASHVAGSATDVGSLLQGFVGQVRTGEVI